MSVIYMYADETSNLDYSAKDGASRYFGIGTAVFSGDHPEALWNGLALRFELERSGVELARGVHAKDDSWKTRRQVFTAIASQAPRFDTTLLAKENAYSSVRSAGALYLYKLAWFLHFKEIARHVSTYGDELFVVAATLTTKARRSAVRSALQDVCGQGPTGRTVRLCIWDSATTWGLQVADHGPWVVQRKLEKGQVPDYAENAVWPTLKARFMPWGK